MLPSEARFADTGPLICGLKQHKEGYSTIKKKVNGGSGILDPSLPRSKELDSHRSPLVDLIPCNLDGFDNEFGLRVSSTNSFPPSLQDSF